MRVKFALVAVLMFAAFSFASGPSKKMAELPQELKGEAIPNFFVLGSDNETEFTRNGLKAEAKKSGAKRVVLSFFATWCVNCQAEFVLLAQNIAKLHENKVQVVLIDVGEKIVRDGKKVNEFVRSYADNSFPFYFDQNVNLLKSFGIVERDATTFTLPIIIVMDPELRVLNVFTEAGDDFPQVLWGDL